MKLIQTKDYLLLIDEEAEIKPNDLFWYRNYKVLLCTGINNTFILTDNKKPKHPSFGQPPQLCKKIIAYYPLASEAKELDLPKLPNPFEEVDFKNIVEDLPEHDDLKSTDGTYSSFHYQSEAMIKGYELGYKAAQSKQFSLEDVEKAIEMARSYTHDGAHGDYFHYTEEEIIQSLSTQKLPSEFIPEYEEYAIGFYGMSNGEPTIDTRLKTTTNLSGKIELVGIYKY